MAHLPPDDLRRKASTFTVKASRMLLHHWIRLWKLRNEQRQPQHSPNAVTVHDDQVCNRLCSLYIRWPCMRPYDTRIFYPSVNEHLRNDIPAIESWITVNQALIAHSIAQVSGLSLGSQSLITTHFAPPPPPSHRHGSQACSSVPSPTFRIPHWTFSAFLPLAVVLPFSSLGIPLIFTKDYCADSLFSTYIYFGPLLPEGVAARGRHMISLSGSLEPRKIRNGLLLH
jgi:hypothetical protein